MVSNFSKIQSALHRAFQIIQFSDGGGLEDDSLIPDSANPDHFWFKVIASIQHVYDP
jgi:hypothetical protein